MFEVNSFCPGAAAIAISTKAYPADERAPKSCAMNFRGRCEFKNTESLVGPEDPPA